MLKQLSSLDFASAQASPNAKFDSVEINKIALVDMNKIAKICQVLVILY